jgi:hypothetical protein
VGKIDINSKVLKSFVKCWMRNNVRQYVDGCGEVNFTKLAEDAADEFEVYEGVECTIPEWVFEFAIETETYGQEHGLI